MAPIVQKWENGLEIRIPKHLAEKIRLKEGEEVDFQIKGDAIIIRKKKNGLESLLSRITPENLHGEIDTGGSVGSESW
ncbi:AbrB/MazE/SpoVT family DNA-binding domain-containing protein [Thermoflavimicrobium dichotomicum]|uniref:Antitoxin MazE n=1 Tax=Thermoflavimicrobium dichotomicum TaxID=46223 RepID=A0A1I3SIS6_9BACL|nr:AbrB/MazE/SpoVT family DNA-binding domain-containing protein [Thermoflavimicrobium dichotomicum]SFJ58320.1 antitoxin MazE [Thermoflavimicrobium dichotomicum]